MELEDRFKGPNDPPCGKLPKELFIEAQMLIRDGSTKYRGV